MQTKKIKQSAVDGISCLLTWIVGLCTGVMVLRYVMGTDNHPFAVIYDWLGIHQSYFIPTSEIEILATPMLQIIANVIFTIFFYATLAAVAAGTASEITGIVYHGGFRAYKKHQAEERAIQDASRAEKRAQSVTIQVMFEKDFEFENTMGHDELAVGKWGWKTSYQGNLSAGLADTEVEALAEAVRVAYSSVGLSSSTLQK